MHKSNVKSTITEDGRCTFSHSALGSEFFKKANGCLLRDIHVLSIVLKFLDFPFYIVNGFQENVYTCRHLLRNRGL